MLFHKSHSKKDLIEVIELFNLNIDNYDELNKKELIKEIELHINEIDHSFIPNYDILPLNNKEELIDYLAQPNENKMITIKDKNKLMLKAKKILCYCKNGYDLDRSFFNTLGHLLDEANDVARHGQIPTCRRAIRELNKDSKITHKIQIILPPKVKRELDIKLQTKLILGGSSSLKVESGKFIVVFE